MTHFRTHVSMRTRAECARSMAVLLESGVSMHEMLTTLCASTNVQALTSALERVRERIIQGTSLADACESERDIFGSLWIGLVRTGEHSGTLAKSLSLIANIFERHADLEQEVQNALLYPKIVLGASLFLGSGLTLFVLPRLTGIFESFDIELPLITRILIASTHFVTTHTLGILTSLAVVAGAWMYLSRFEPVRMKIDRAVLSIPGIGTMLRNYHAALVLRLLGTLLASGTTLVESLSAISTASSNTHIARLIRSVEREVLTGTPLSTALTPHTLVFSRLTLRTIAVGEQSGTLSATCERLSEYLEKDVVIRARRLPVIIEPILLIGVAFVVGVIALAIIMPIYSITGNLHRI